MAMETHSKVAGPMISSFDDRVSSREQRRLNGDAKCFGDLEINDHLELYLPLAEIIRP